MKIFLFLCNSSSLLYKDDSIKHEQGDLITKIEQKGQHIISIVPFQVLK